MFSSSAIADDQMIDLSDFQARISENGLPGHWRHLNFSKIDPTTRYEVVPDATHGTVIEARSDGAAGAMVRSVWIDPRHYPVLTWSWKISTTLSKSSLDDIEGDDFPVRLMVAFDSDTRNGTPASLSGFQSKTLCYVWMEHEPVNTIAVNPSHDHVVTIVAANSSDVGSWRDFWRNIVDDYRAAFSEEPGMIIGVALMTDSDNTGAHVTAWYGPISLYASDS